MNFRLSSLAERIRREVGELDRVVHRVEFGWKRFVETGDDYYLDAVALNLHGFYSGVERIFEIVASMIDGDRPQGENWHQVLLQQMASEVPHVRPAVISDKVFAYLDEYRGFRHVVRNVYTFKFDPRKVGKLVVDLEGGFLRLRTELLAFSEFLQRNA